MTDDRDTARGIAASLAWSLPTWAVLWVAIRFGWALVVECGR